MIWPMYVDNTYNALLKSCTVLFFSTHITSRVGDTAVRHIQRRMFQNILLVKIINHQS